MATPTQGALGLRDPFIMRKQDGTFVVLATDLQGTDWNRTSVNIHVWDSTDLRTFTGYRLLKLHDMTNTHSWAPEAYWDASRGQYGILYSSVNSSGHNVIMVSYTTDFRTTANPQVFFDPGYDVIDGNLAVGVNGVNYLYYKENQTLVGARSTSLNPGSFTKFSTPVAHGGTEAPTVVKSHTSSTWWLWGDTYTPNGVFYAWQTSNLASGTWTPVDQRLYTQPLNSKHGTIATITASRVRQPRRALRGTGLEPAQVVQLPGPLRPAQRLRRQDRPVPHRPVRRLAVEAGAGPGGLGGRLLPVRQPPHPLPAALQLQPAPRRERRHDGVRRRTRPSTGPRAWPTPPGRRSARTTSRRATSGTPGTSCGSTPSPRRPNGPTRPSRSATDRLLPPGR